METTNYRNKNRGYQQLRVWQDAIDLYVAACSLHHSIPPPPITPLLHRPVVAPLEKNHEKTIDTNRPLL